MSSYSGTYLLELKKRHLVVCVTLIVLCGRSVIGIQYY